MAHTCGQYLVDVETQPMLLCNDMLSKAPVLIGLISPLLAGTLVAGPPALQARGPEQVHELQFAVDGIAMQAFDVKGAAQPQLLVLSATGGFQNDQGRREARLYATLFDVVDDSFQPAWVVQDLVRDCEFDLMLEFTLEPVHVADADGDGTPEIWVSYRLACRSDVSPSSLKLIGYEGTQKLALRGQSQVDAGMGTLEGGSHEADAALRKQPKILADAKAYWQRVQRER